MDEPSPGRNAFINDLFNQNHFYIGRSPTTPIPPTITSEKMWLASHAKPLVDGDVHSVGPKKILSWLDEVLIKDVPLQLRMLGNSFEKLRRSAGEKKNQSN